MRTIKFRILFKGLLVGQKTHWEYFYLPDDLGFDEEIYLNKENYVMESFTEFTGLLDKNGVEIYESDLVETLDGVFQVSWNQLHCAWCLFQNGMMKNDIIADWINDDGSTPKRWEKKEFKVIGNVFQNPELLNN